MKTDKFCDKEISDLESDKARYTITMPLREANTASMKTKEIDERVEKIIDDSWREEYGWRHTGAIGIMIHKIRQEYKKDRSTLRQSVLEEVREKMPKKEHITKWKAKPEGDGDKWCCVDGCEACARTQGEELGFNKYHDQVTSLINNLIEEKK